MSNVVFFCHDDRLLIEVTEYYKQDIDALQALGHKVVVATRYREIPLVFDAIFIWWWTYALWPVLLSRVCGRPSIITGAFNFRFPPSFQGTDYFRRPWWQRVVISTATRLSRLNLFINEAERQECSEFFDLKNAQTYPHTVHEDYLRGPSATRNKVLFNLAWSGKENLRRKGIPELLQALRLLKEDGTAVHLYLAGPPGDGATFLSRMITELQIEELVTCMGQLTRADKIEMLRTSELYVQPSHYEGFGLATAEAMGCGACVITCDVGAVRAVVADCGLYVPPGAPTALAQAIRHALSDDLMRHKLQAAAHHRASTLFTAASKREQLKRYLLELGIP